MSTEEEQQTTHPVPPHQIAKAVKLSYAQAVLVAVFGASTAGGFITAYFLKLGATNEQIGLLSSLPMYAVFFQLMAAVMIERGACRKRMTIAGSLLSVSCWGLVIALPFIMKDASGSTRITVLIGVFTLISIFGQFAGNARASWLGDLIPSDRLGTFFGKLIVYGGVIGSVLTITQGRFLDYMQSAGLAAFGWVFAFGMLFGIANAVLFIPQADVPTAPHSLSLKGLIKQTFRNRGLMAFMAFVILWNMQSIGWPFYATYILRDLHISYYHYSIMVTIQGLTTLLSSPFWGRVVNRHGCRPVIIVCAAITVPIAMFWAFIDSHLSYFIGVPVINIVSGFANGGIAVAVSTLTYRVMQPVGRSIQLAIYSVTVTFLVAPMPILGGHLPTWLNSIGIPADLRSTFYASQILALAALLVAKRVVEPGSSRTGEMVESLKDRVVAKK